MDVITDMSRCNEYTQVIHTCNLGTSHIVRGVTINTNILERHGTELFQYSVSQNLSKRHTTG